MRRKRDTYTVEPGRNIYKNGERFIYVGVCQGVYDYADVDLLTHDICRLLNKDQPRTWAQRRQAEVTT
jgi:hypothetical protein